MKQSIVIILLLLTVGQVMSEPAPDPALLIQPQDGDDVLVEVPVYQLRLALWYKEAYIQLWSQYVTALETQQKLEETRKLLTAGLFGKTIVDVVIELLRRF